MLGYACIHCINCRLSLDFEYCVICGYNICSKCESFLGFTASRGAWVDVYVYGCTGCYERNMGIVDVYSDDAYDPYNDDDDFENDSTY